MVMGDDSMSIGRGFEYWRRGHFSHLFVVKNCTYCMLEIPWSSNWSSNLRLNVLVSSLANLIEFQLESVFDSSAICRQTRSAPSCLHDALYVAISSRHAI